MAGGREIERKFLVASGRWHPPVPGVAIRQGYLAAGPDCTVRVRVAGETAFLTIKGPTTGISRMELEWPIPVEDAEVLLATCRVGGLVEKIRYRVPHGPHLWEVDQFLGENRGLLLAEIELNREDEGFELPAWVGAEVSNDNRYANSRLARTPFRTWPHERNAGGEEFNPEPARNGLEGE